MEALHWFYWKCWWHISVWNDFEGRNLRWLWEIVKLCHYYLNKHRVMGSWLYSDITLDKGFKYSIVDKNLKYRMFCTLFFFFFVLNTVGMEVFWFSDASAEKAFVWGAKEHANIYYRPVQVQIFPSVLKLLMSVCPCLTSVTQMQ